MRKPVHSAFLILIGLYLFTSIAYLLAIPTYEGPDETEHVAYVLWLRQRGTLPDPVTDINTTLHQQASQNPLYYGIMALLSHILPVDYSQIQVAPAVNPWRSYPAPREIPDNRNAYLMSVPGHVLNDSLSEQIKAVFWLRLISPLFGIMMLTGIYCAGLLLWNKRSWALLAAMIAAFTPQLLQGFVIVNNDTAVIAFGTWTITASLYLRRRWNSPYALIFAGFCAGLAALSKSNGVILWATPVIALAVGWWEARSNLKQLSALFTLLLVTIFIFGGWWYVRAFILYGDPFGFSTHQQMSWAATEAPTLNIIVGRVPSIAASIWADFGWYKILPGNWGYVLPVLLLIVGAWGWRGRRPDLDSLILVITLGIGLAALLAWNWFSTFVPGRLFLPVYPALILLVVQGLQSFPRSRIIWAGALPIVAFAMIPTTLYPAFGVPKLLDNPPSALSGIPLDFGIARFAGYRIDSDLIQQGEQHLIELCWQAPAGDTSSPVPYAFALHLVDTDNRLIGGRDSYPGLGKYTLWQPGKAFCDRFYLPVTGEVQPARIYPLVLNLYDYTTQQNLPSTAPDGSRNSVIGYVRTRSDLTYTPDEMVHQVASFGGILLLTEQRSDSTLQLTWGVKQSPSRMLKTFVHMVDADGVIAAQVDVTTGGDSYPAWAWNTGG
ncbi:MAG TPA: glycosyltransferase family 39 protein, partial [Phototrophicaceae bacterium]|nr:glycosyltransferase family 39 protein [Phototrophicaceae bacterium]